MNQSLIVDRRRVLAMTAAAAAVLPLQSVVPSGASEAIAALMAKFRRAYETLDAPALEALLAEDLIFSDPTFHHSAKGLAEMRKIIAESVPQFHSIRLVVEHELVAPPWAVVRQEQVIVRKVASMPHGHTVRVRGVSLFRIERGRIHEWHDYYDAAGYERQVREAAAKTGGGR